MNFISRKNFIQKAAIGFLIIPEFIGDKFLRLIRNISPTRNDQFNCVLTPSEVSGPFNLGPELLRKDITEGIKGFPLTLRFEVSQVPECNKIEGAIISLWQADPSGIYSGFGEVHGNKGGKKDTTYLRGYQITNTNGIAEFKTVFPGWYDGRVAHIHFEIILSNGNSTLVSQVYFPPDLERTVYAENIHYRAKGHNPFNWENDFVIKGDEAKAKKLLPEINQNDGTIEAIFKVGLEL